MRLCCCGPANRIFEGLIPYLLLAATIIFAAGPAIRDRAEKAGAISPAWCTFIELLFAIYGGYFGAGLGVLLMAALTIVGVKDIQMANAQKNLIATLITTLSVGIFIAADIIAWPQTIVVLVGAGLGGYTGARMARKISVRALRFVVITVGLALSVYYFV